MILDLNDLAVMCRENLKPLWEVGFDEAKIKEAADKSAFLCTLRAEAAVDKDMNREQKLTRDRAYTHLKEAVDCIRAAGQFAFRNNPVRARGYASAYFRKARAFCAADAVSLVDSSEDGFSSLEMHLKKPTESRTEFIFSATFSVFFRNRN